MTPRITAIVLLLVSGCVTTLHAPRTQPEVVVSQRSWPAQASKNLLILSPSLLAELTGGANFAAAVPPASGLDGLTTAGPGDLSIATAAVERAAFDGGWNPMSRPGVVRLASNHQAAVALRELAVRGPGTLDEAAVVLARAAEVDLVLLVRSWTLGWSARAPVGTSNHSLCPAGGELELSIIDKAGRQVWWGRARSSAAAVADILLTERFGSAKASPPDLACVSSGPCGECPLPPNLGPVVQGALAIQAAGAIFSIR